MNQNWVEVFGRALMDLKDIIADYDAAQLVGSAYTLDPAKAEDIDLLMLVQDKGYHHDSLVQAGFEDGGSMADGPDEDCWRSYKRGRFNLLLCDDLEFYRKFCTAAEVCRLLRLENKEARRAVHMIVMDGYTAGGLVGVFPDLFH